MVVLNFLHKYWELELRISYLHSKLLGLIHCAISSFLSRNITEALEDQRNPMGIYRALAMPEMYAHTSTPLMTIFLDSLVTLCT